MNEFLFAPLVLRVLTKCFLLHPTRLSMICAQPHPAFPYRTRLAGLETCSVAQTPNREYLRLEKLFENFKEPTRKAVFRFVQWPARSFVTVPYRGLYSYFTIA